MTNNLMPHQQALIIAAALLYMESDLHRTALHMASGTYLQDVDGLFDALSKNADLMDAHYIALGAEEWLENNEGTDEIGAVHPDPFAGLGDAAKEAFVKFLLALPADYPRAFVVKHKEVDSE